MRTTLHNLDSHLTTLAMSPHPPIPPIPPPILWWCQERIVLGQFTTLSALPERVWLRETKIVSPSSRLSVYSYVTLCPPPYPHATCKEDSIHQSTSQQTLIAYICSPVEYLIFTTVPRHCNVIFVQVLAVDKHSSVDIFIEAIKCSGQQYHYCYVHNV